MRNSGQSIPQKADFEEWSMRTDWAYWKNYTMHRTTPVPAVFPKQLQCWCKGIRTNIRRESISLWPKSYGHTCSASEGDHAHIVYNNRSVWLQHWVLLLFSLYAENLQNRWYWWLKAACVKSRQWQVRFSLIFLTEYFLWCHLFYLFFSHNVFYDYYNVIFFNWTCPDINDAVALLMPSPSREM